MQACPRRLRRSEVQNGATGVGAEVYSAIEVEANEIAEVEEFDVQDKAEETRREDDEAEEFGDEGDDEDVEAQEDEARNRAESGAKDDTQDVGPRHGAGEVRSKTMILKIRILVALSPMALKTLGLSMMLNLTKPGVQKAAALLPRLIRSQRKGTTHSHRFRRILAVLNTVGKPRH